MTSIMKRNIVFVVLSVLTMTLAAQSTWTKGAFETREYRNLFVEAGYAPDQVEAKLQEVFNDVFFGPDKVYFEVGDSTGYVSDLCGYDGQPMPGFGGRRNGGSNFRYDSWRVPMNIALDYEWSCADQQWQQQYGETIQNFFHSQGIDRYVDQYRTDGTLPADDEILQAGGFKKLRHSIGLVSTLAAASVLCSHDKKKEFIDALWNAKHVPFEDGYFDAHYDGLLRLLAFMHLSGHYRIIFPQ